MARFLFAAVVLLGLSMLPKLRQAPVSRESPRVCMALSAAQFGELPLTVLVGDSKVEFVEWKARSLDANPEWIGFSYRAEHPLEWSAQFGGRAVEGRGYELFDEPALLHPRSAPLTQLTLCQT